MLINQASLELTEICLTPKCCMYVSITVHHSLKDIKEIKESMAINKGNQGNNANTMRKPGRTSYKK